MRILYYWGMCCLATKAIFSRAFADMCLPQQYVFACVRASFPQHNVVVCIRVYVLRSTNCIRVGFMCLCFSQQTVFACIRVSVLPWTKCIRVSFVCFLSESACPLIGEYCLIYIYIYIYFLRGQFQCLQVVLSYALFFGRIFSQCHSLIVLTCFSAPFLTCVSSCLPALLP